MGTTRAHEKPHLLIGDMPAGQRIGPLEGEADPFRTGFSTQEPDDARREIAFSLARVERALAEHPYLAGPTFSLADINVLSSVQRMPRWAPDLMNETATPRVRAWLERLEARPAVRATLSAS